MSNEPEMLSREEILLAADRFEICHNDGGSTLQLSDDFTAEGKHLSSIDDCMSFVDSAFDLRCRISIEKTS